MSLTALVRPASAASLNDLSPLPPMSKTRPTLALLLTGATLAGVEAGALDAGALHAGALLVAELAGAELAGAELAGADVAALVAAELARVEDAVDEPLLLLLPQAATDMAET